MTDSSLSMRRSVSARGSLATSMTRAAGPPARSVRVHTDGGEDRIVAVLDSLVVGRGVEGIDLRDRKVSRRHLLLRTTMAGLTVEDLGSSNGTTVNGSRVTTETAVRPGDVIGVGGSTITVLAPPGPGDAGSASPSASSAPGVVPPPGVDVERAGPATAPSPSPGAVAWRAELSTGAHPPQTLVLTHRFGVGRAGPGLILHDPAISRRHLEFRLESGALVVEDAGSANGTRVNGRRITTSVPLRPGDVVGLGDSTITIVGPAVPGPDPQVAPAPAGRAAPEAPERPTAPPSEVTPGRPVGAAAGPPALPPLVADTTDQPAAESSSDGDGGRRRIDVRAEPLPPFPNFTQLPRRLPIGAWYPIRAVAVAVYLGLCVVLLVRPDGGLFFFWKLFIPVAPLLLFVALGLWRNICPLAAANQTPRVLGFTRGRRAPPWLAERGGGYLVAASLFLVLVPTRLVLFNTSGPATAVLLLAAIIVAFLGGWVFKGKSGWCSSHCPMLPIERLYGQTPFVRVPNSHCQPCVGCTKHCYDFNPGVAYQADMADPDPDWSAPRKFFAGALVGVMVGFFWLRPAADAPWWSSYGTFYLAMLASVGAFFLLDAYVRVPTSRLAAVFGAVALNIFYWFNAQTIADSWGQVLGGVDLRPFVVWEVRVGVLALTLWWIVRTVRVEHLFVAQAVGKPGVHLSPAATKFLAAGGDDGDRQGPDGSAGPQVRFVPDDKRAVAKPGQSILDVAEAAGVPIEVGCRMGVCGSDPVAVVEGMEHCSPIDSDEENTLRRLGFAANTRLACCARLDGPVSVSVTPERAGPGDASAPATPPDPNLRRVVIIGNGVAGTTAADFIRRGHPECEIEVIGREPHPLYNRMGIARLVYGRSAMQGLYLFDDSWYQERSISTWLNTHADEIDLGNRTVSLATGDSLPFDKLILATGSSSTVPPVAGWGAPGCFVMREAADAIALRAFVQTNGARRAVVAGAGLLGLEAAHALRELGLGVVALDRGPRLMARQSDERCSELLGSYFGGLGIEVLNNITAQELRVDETGQVDEVVLSDGTSIAASVFVVCAGITPNADLARAADIACDRGVLVNARMETSAPGVYAVGDVVEFEGRTPGLWPTAVAQAEIAAANVLGRDERFDPGLTPVLLKGVGLDMMSAGSYREEPGDEVVLIDGPGYEYRKLVIRAGRVVGAILLGRPDDTPNVLKAVKQQASVSHLVADLRAGNWSVLDPANLARDPAPA